MDLASEIERAVSLLETKTDEYAKHATEAAHAEVAYKRSYAIALLRAEGSVAQREAEATLKADEELVARRGAEATRDACLEALRSVRAQLSALQTLVNAERSQT